MWISSWLPFETWAQKVTGLLVLAQQIAPHQTLVLASLALCLAGCSIDKLTESANLRLATSPHPQTTDALGTQKALPKRCRGFFGLPKTVFLVSLFEGGDLSKTLHEPNNPPPNPPPINPPNPSPAFGDDMLASGGGGAGPAGGAGTLRLLGSFSWSKLLAIAARDDHFFPSPVVSSNRQVHSLTPC